MEGGEAFATVFGMVATYLSGYLGVLLQLETADRLLPKNRGVRTFAELCQNDWAAVRKVVLIYEIRRKIWRLKSIRSTCVFLATILIVLGLAIGGAGILMDYRNVSDAGLTAVLREIGFGWMLGAAVLPSFILFAYAYGISRESAYAARRFR